MTNLTVHDLEWLRKATHETENSSPEMRTLVSQMVGTLIAERLEASQQAESWRREPPVDKLLRCPSCDKQHLDIGEFRERVHRKHRCENTPDGEKTGCGFLWTPHQYATRGVSLKEIADRFEVDRRLQQVLDNLVELYAGRPPLNGDDQDAVDRLYRERGELIVAQITTDYARVLPT